MSVGEFFFHLILICLCFMEAGCIMLTLFQGGAIASVCVRVCLCLRVYFYVFALVVIRNIVLTPHANACHRCVCLYL